MNAYSQDLRDRVLAALDAGGRTGAAAVQFAVSPAWVRRLRQRRSATGETAARSRANHRVPFHERHAAAIRAAVAAKSGRAQGAPRRAGTRRDRLGLTAAPRPVVEKKSVRAAEQDRPMSPPAPVSNSGRLAAMIRAASAGWSAEVVPDPDAVLKQPGPAVATADAGILDRRGPWVNLARRLVEASVPTAFVVDLATFAGRAGPPA